MSPQTNDRLLVSLQEDGLEEFLLRGNRQVRQLLQELVRNHSLISVHLLPGSLSFLSTILTLSDDEEWIFLDPSPNETIYRRSLKAERLLCITQLNKIRIQFRLHNVVEIPVGNHPALAAPVPNEVLRLQRRDAFRLQVPLSHNLKCVLPEQENEHAEFRKKGIEVSVIDISAGGLSMELPISKTSPSVGDRIIGCHLKLPDHLIKLDLEVRNHGLRILANGKQMLRLGCSFISLPTQSANQIQRYIYQIEREMRANGT
ncbi:MAG: flagellar brake protein [Azoarcus sp.]|jgi:c-di-GMP-binding flagellar brake protein YcgR|nr:flagellar brake protein [Azoarcus sp.]